MSTLFSSVSFKISDISLWLPRACIPAALGLDFIPNTCRRRIYPTAEHPNVLNQVERNLNTHLIP